MMKENATKLEDITNTKNLIKKNQALGRKSISGIAAKAKKVKVGVARDDAKSVSKENAKGFERAEDKKSSENKVGGKSSSIPGVDEKKPKVKTVATNLGKSAAKTTAKKIGSRASIGSESEVTRKRAEKPEKTRRSIQVPEMADKVRGEFEPDERKEPKRSSRPNPSLIQTDKDVAELESHFPNIDPAFLKAQYLKMKRSVEDTIDLLSVKKNPVGDVPLKSVSTWKQSDVDKIRRKYTTEFAVDDYVRTIPDPWNYFLRTEVHNSIRYADHSLQYLKNKFTKHYFQIIQDTLISCDYSLYRANKELSDRRKSRMLKMRQSHRMKCENGAGDPVSVDFQFLQEVAFIEHETEITEKLKKMESERYERLKSILQTSSLVRCQYCCTCNLLWEEIVCCGRNHVICKNCINYHVETEISADNFSFKCILIDCMEPLSVESIQDMLKPDLLAIIVRKNHLDELISAGIDNLLHCPRCYHINMAAAADEIVFYCTNPACKKETCRKCKRDRHEPEKCPESDTDEIYVPSICFFKEEEISLVGDSNQIRRLIEACSVCRHLSDVQICPHFETQEVGTTDGYDVWKGEIVEANDFPLLPETIVSEAEF